MDPASHTPRPLPPAAGPAQVAAVIDIGATAIRMVIAQIDGNGGVRHLESLQQAVHLGKDTFTTGRIQPSTIAECVRILNGYRQVMREYGVTSAGQIRAIATSSVREAENRDAFLDRIYMATQINLEAIEEPEVNRFTYIAVQDLLAQQPELCGSDVLIIEVGGGTTELLLAQKGNVTYSNTYNLGALRLRQTLETWRAPADRVGAILLQELQRIAGDIHRSVPVPRVPYLIAISGDARFAASQLVSRWEETDAAAVGLRALANLAGRIVRMSVDDLVREYGLPFQEAETLGPALLAYVQLARTFRVKKIIVPKSSMRDGLLREMAAREHWTKEFTDQVVRSAITLGRRCHFEEHHAVQVSDLARQLFRELTPEHQLGPRYELFLQVAALLHEIGMFISNRSYHKHSLYIIMNSDLFGLTHQDMLLIALIARYHRRAAPRAYHEGYINLDRDQRIAVAKLAAILRVADALDCRGNQQVRRLSVAREPNQFVITAGDVEDLTLERLSLKQKGPMFDDVYGMKPVLREGLAAKAAAPS